VERRKRLEKLLAKAGPPVYLTPATRERKLAQEWLQHFEGAGLDGVIAKPAHAPYQPDKRAMIKVKHARTAECVVAGLRWYKKAPGALGSLLLGLYDDAGELHHVGVTSSFTMEARKALAKELQGLKIPLEKHPWQGADIGATSRWSAGKDLSWEPLRIERVCEVKYDHMQGDRFRHAAIFLRWRPDKPPRECTYAQLEVTPAYELKKVFGAKAGRG
jgi:ATP-dependent DNA ligase